MSSFQSIFTAEGVFHREAAKVIFATKKKTCWEQVFVLTLCFGVLGSAKGRTQNNLKETLRKIPKTKVKQVMLSLEILSLFEKFKLVKKKMKPKEKILIITAPSSIQVSLA